MIDKRELEEILQNVERPGRYTGGEWNSIKKDPNCVTAKVVLAFPDLYEVGMSYLGQKILYHVLNAQPSILAERVFAPWKDLERELRTKSIPLFSLENRLTLDRFDIIGFSLLYELNYSNIVNMLDLGRIPLLAKERNLDWPLVIAGGPGAFNPEPLADFFDLFLIGDGEEAFLEIIEKFVALKKELNDKNTILEELAKIEGVYVPSFYVPFQPKKSGLLAVKSADTMPSKIKKRILYPFRQAPFPEDIVVPHIKVIFDRVSLEVARGCPQKCRFCQASSLYFPPRVKSPSSVITGIMNSLRSTGYDTVSLAALSISDYPYLEEVIGSLMEELEKQKVSLSLSSIRPKGLTSGVVKNIVKVRKTGFTLVPEAGTERLRSVINKSLKDDEIRDATDNAFSAGWKLLKLYFMIGLPTEREEDLSGIADMVEEIINRGRRILKKNPQINLSLSSFIPKPHTPFQWLPMEEEDILESKYRYVLSRLKKYPFVRLKRSSLKNTILEAIFSRGDRKLNGVLLQAWKLGARFDSWDDSFQFQIWEKAFETENIDYKMYLTALDKDSELPWNHIDTGLKKSHLLEELGLALKGQASASCMERECADCQGCSLSKFYQERFDEQVPPAKGSFRSIGKRTKKVYKYRASFVKKGAARFLSHIDLNAIIQQGFRRAGISVSYSQGFHPKMQMGYLPALPLGMEGRAEWLEFKSPFIFSEQKFESHINEYLPAGIRFSGLMRMDESQVSLSKQIRTLVYSLDLSDKKVREAVESLFPWKNRENAYYYAVQRLVDNFIKKVEGNSLEGAFVDPEKAKLFLNLKPGFKEGLKPQQVVEKIFLIENPVYLMAREKILFHD